MEIVFIFNGLGNQMSQYALYLSKRNLGCKVRYAYNIRSLSDHNGFELDRVFGITYPNNLFNKCINIIYRLLFANKYLFLVQKMIYVLRQMNVYSIKEKDNYDYDYQILTRHKGIVLYYGGWHSEKYFLSNADIIKDKFRFNISKLNSESLVLYHRLSSLNAVALHVRRGDYMAPEHYNVFGCVCGIEYYKAAIQYIQSQILNPVFIVFSNDIEWVKENITGIQMIFVDFNKKENSWMDMCLMSCCEHNIISNSTFSWWGAWLNNNKNKIVVCPKYFMSNIDTKDIYPESWIKI